MLGDHPYAQPWKVVSTKLCCLTNFITEMSVQYLHRSGHSMTTSPPKSTTALAMSSKLSQRSLKSFQWPSIFSNPSPMATLSVSHGLPPAHGIELQRSVRPLGQSWSIWIAFRSPSEVRRSSSMVSLTTSHPLLRFDDLPNMLSCPQHHSIITRSKWSCAETLLSPPFVCAGSCGKKRVGVPFRKGGKKNGILSPSMSYSFMFLTSVAQARSSLLSRRPFSSIWTGFVVEQPSGPLIPRD